MHKFLLNETGLEVSEYAVAAVLVAIAVVAAFTLLGDSIGVSSQLAAVVKSAQSVSLFPDETRL